ncbi:site-specific DNA-methyltransferase [Paenarthrobacter sp. AR 02]|uniref:site-specific DNA-methyltransferase n=1 Tax=Paenarthrobacter sp. AR 02 TaxID=2899821 RepID=UPI001F485DA1|nr:site-specific DNA-methyltransferase [Paenarthrobacter sp. AR 02]MCF3140818.1 site-specific DNA-methyltransferase [Paenarthrobacter sp. AR 02]
MSNPKGRLELTWMGKDQALIPVDHGKYDYEWVSTQDPRAREVRTVDVNGSYGEGPDDNLLITGDSGDALRALVSVPEWADRYRGKVKLVYIDPPFNTSQVGFEHYADSLEHSIWLTLMRDRLVYFKDLLADDGSVWVHLDDAEVHRMRCLLDEIFGAANFVATVVWQKVYAPENRTDVSASQDYILLYAKDRPTWAKSRNLMPRDEKQTAQYKNPDNDPRGPWKAADATAKADVGRRASQFYTLRTPAGNEYQPPSGRCWLYTEDRFEEMVADNRVWFGKDGGSRPAIKKFLTEVKQGVTPSTWWPYTEVGHNQEGKKEIRSLFPSIVPFSTPKPERLLERILHIGSNPGDIVMDCFAGSGTTLAVAHKMGRRWVGVELQSDTVATFIEPRLKAIIDGTETGGVTASTGWAGGGGFGTAVMAPSMYEVDEDGTVYLSEDAVNGAFSRSVCGQLGFRFEEGDPIFCGRKGRTRLAVIDGMADEHVVRVVVSSLAAQEKAMVVAKGLQEGVAELLRELSPGSRIRKAPEDLFMKRTVK